MAVKPTTAKAKPAPAKKVVAAKTPVKKTPVKAPVKKVVVKKEAAPKATAAKAAAPKAPVKKAVPEVLTLKHLAAELSEAHEMPKKQAELVVSDLIDRMGGHLKKGKKLRISGLGVLEVRSRPARKGRNPATGEAIKIKASKKVAFRPAKDLKERVL